MEGGVLATNPQMGSKWSFPIALNWTARRRIPARASTNPGSENGDVIPP